MLVIKNADAYEVLAENSLDEGIDASPAIVDNTLFVRGVHHLYAFARPTAKETEGSRQAGHSRR